MDKRLMKIEKREQELRQKINEIIEELEQLAAEKATILLENQSEKAMLDKDQEVVKSAYRKGTGRENNSFLVQDAIAIIKDGVLERNGYDY